MNAKRLAGIAALASCLAVGSAQAVPVSLELYLAADVSGSIDDADFNLQRQGFASAFQSAAVKDAITATSSGIAVKLVDFANNIAVAVDWTLITNAAEADAFAAAILAAPRGAGIGINDGQSNLINSALSDMVGNDYSGARQVLDIASEGAQDIDGCTFDNVDCPAVQIARDNFLQNGGTTINAIWLNDRNFFGLDPTDIINAYEYGLLNVIGGPNAFQTFAQDFTAFGPAIEAKILREITQIPEPGTLTLLGLGLAGLGAVRRKKLAA